MCDCNELAALREALARREPPRIIVREKKTKDFDPDELARLVEKTREQTP